MRNYLAEDVLNSEMVQVKKRYQVYLGEKGSVLSGANEYLELSIFSEICDRLKNDDDNRLQELEKVDRWFKPGKIV